MSPAPGNEAFYDLHTPGEKFGEYQIFACLAYNPMGTLYHLEPILEGEPRCFFALSPAAVANEEFLSNLITLSEKEGDFIHNHLTAPGEKKVINERKGFTCELFEGQHLADYLESQRAAAPVSGGENTTNTDRPAALPPEEVQQIISQVAMALNHLHSKGYYHCALTPQSITRTPEGKIRVFGGGYLQQAPAAFQNAVLKAQPPKRPDGETAPGIHPPAHLPPEQQTSLSPAAAVDIYSLGTLAYYLFTGETWQPSETPASEVNSAVPAAWDNLLGKCLSPDPTARYTSIKAIQSDLEKIGDKPRSSLASRLGPPTKVTQQSPEGDSTTPSTESTPSRGAPVLLIFMLLLLLAGGGAAYFFLGGDSDAGGKPVQTAASDDTATLKLTLQPDSVTIDLGKQGTFTSKDGTLPLALPPGKYQATFTAPWHEPVERTLSIPKDQDKPIELEITLNRADAPFDLVTSPGAQAYAVLEDDTTLPLGQADAQGNLSVRELVPAGKFTLKIEKNGFETITESKTYPEASTGTIPVYEHHLSGKAAYLSLITEPAGATVTLGEKELGITPLENVQVPTGKPLKLRAKLEGYRAQDYTLTLDPGENKTVELPPLASEAGSLFITITTGGEATTPEFLEEATITLGDHGEYSGTTTVLENIPVGTYTLTIKHPDYGTETQQIFVPDNARLPVKVDLDAKPASLNITLSQPTDYKMYVNGMEIPTSEENRYLFAPGSEVRLEIHAEDYYIVKRTIQPQPNETIDWEVELVAIPAPTKNEAYTVPYAGIELVWLNNGAFRMGSPRSEPQRDRNESPLTFVTLSQGFWIGKYEITQREFQAITGRTPARFRTADKPVEQVSWNLANKYCELLNTRESAAGRLPAGYEYRLPTEAEWEYACRAGTETAFSWGDTADSTMGNFKGEYPRTSFDEQPPARTTSGSYGTQPAGSYEANSFGLYDMHGNVSEWVIDAYEARHPGGQQTDWVNLAEESKHIARGGSWDDTANDARSAARGTAFDPSSASDSIGFRIVLAPKL